MLMLNASMLNNDWNPCCRCGGRGFEILKLNIITYNSLIIMRCLCSASMTFIREDSADSDPVFYVNAEILSTYSRNMFDDLQLVAIIPLQ